MVKTSESALVALVVPTDLTPAHATCLKNTLGDVDAAAKHGVNNAGVSLDTNDHAPPTGLPLKDLRYPVVLEIDDVLVNKHKLRRRSCAMPPGHSTAVLAQQSSPRRTHSVRRCPTDGSPRRKNAQQPRVSFPSPLSSTSDLASESPDDMSGGAASPKDIDILEHLGNVPGREIIIDSSALSPSPPESEAAAHTAVRPTSSTSSDLVEAVARAESSSTASTVCASEDPTQTSTPQTSNPSRTPRSIKKSTSTSEASGYTPSSSSAAESGRHITSPDTSPRRDVPVSGEDTYPTFYAKEFPWQSPEFPEDLMEDLPDNTSDSLLAELNSTEIGPTPDTSEWPFGFQMFKPCACCPNNCHTKGYWDALERLSESPRAEFAGHFMRLFDMHLHVRSDLAARMAEKVEERLALDRVAQKAELERRVRAYWDDIDAVFKEQYDERKLAMAQWAITEFRAAVAKRVRISRRRMGAVKAEVDELKDQVAIANFAIAAHERLKDALKKRMEEQKGLYEARLECLAQELVKRAALIAELEAQSKPPPPVTRPPEQPRSEPKTPRPRKSPLRWPSCTSCIEVI